MSAIILITSLALIAILFPSLFSYHNRRREALESSRLQWGKPRTRLFKQTEPERYHVAKSEVHESWTIDDRTWEDLYLPAIFRVLDHTRSRIGSQVLYDLLRTPSFDPKEIDRRDHLIRLFTTNQEFREQLQVSLAPLDHDDADLLSNLFLADMPPRPKEYLIYPLLTIASITSIVATIIDHNLWPYLLPLMMINITAGQSYLRKIQYLMQPLRMLNALVRAADRLVKLSATVSDPVIDEMVLPLKQQNGAIRALDGQTRWLLIERNSGNDLLGILIEYLNMVLLLDVNSFVFSMETIRQRKALIGTLFETVGMLDAMIAVASYRHSLPSFSTPTFTEPTKALHIESALHPLLVEGVANSLNIDHVGVLVTGSNMSGKTTFIRTVATNAVLAQTVATCLAKSYVASPLGVLTSIGRNDSLAEGLSYYMAEVENIATFLEDSQESAPCLFVIDEIFRGTNTTERVAASKAVLDALNRPDRPHIVLVSTHDTQLSALLETRWSRYHFLESTQNGELLFDYKIREGIASTRNALRLLAARNYPPAVVQDAEATARKIEGELDSLPSPALLSTLETEISNLPD